uniref:Amine oxidase n=1 Tax=Branchiostoma floridae TaxID=7739 RepID=C3XWH5_BRAFL|eukprot:XP_002611699.1 hypothetical protein BRAFLDRAFT_63612 [Branchiostoma floridae]
MLGFSIGAVYRLGGEGMAQQFRGTSAKVIIIGAGISGIAAAKTLQDNGVQDFIILEGSDRIGGRMRLVDFGGVKIEAGANWVHGIRGNPVWELAQGLDLKGKVQDVAKMVVRDDDGADVTEHAVSRFADLQRARKHAHAMLERKISEDGNDTSIRVALRLAGWKAIAPVDKVVEYFSFDFQNGATPDVTSLLQNEDEETLVDFDDKEYFVTDQRGFGFIVEEMARTFLDKQDPRLQFNKCVDEIKWSNQGVVVRTSDGSEYSAEYALTTFSLGVLQSDHISFVPELPDWKLEEIYQVEMCHYTKIFLKFPFKFWDGKEYIFHAHPKRGYYPIMQDMEAEGCHPPGTNILAVTVTGEESKRVEGLPNSTVASEIMEVLRNLYGEDVPTPVDIFVSRWSQDPLFLGAFTRIPTGAFRDGTEKYKAPVGRLYFGGEAFHERYMGFVHGGLLAGVDKAKDILNAIRDECPSPSDTPDMGKPIHTSEEIGEVTLTGSGHNGPWDNILDDVKETCCQNATTGLSSWSLSEPKGLLELHPPEWQGSPLL